MKVAVIGSRGLTIAEDLGQLMPEGVTEIVSGGARGIDTCAKEYALANGLKLTEFLPDYELYGRAAPLMRNEIIVDYADVVFAFWDGQSRGTAYVIRKCRELNKPCRVFVRTGKSYKDSAKNNAFPPESK